MKAFVNDYREAFGEKVELPYVFGYSDHEVGELVKTQGCMFKAFNRLRAGEAICYNAQTVGCGGGKFYTGFAPMPEYVPDFVSHKEHYKLSPEMVRDYVRQVNVMPADKEFLCFARVDRIADIEPWCEGVLFLAAPDVLSGLLSWIFFDNNSPEAVTAPFGSGCSSAITQAINENRRGGQRTFLALFDLSVRPYFEKDIIGLSVPLSRFKEMCATMRQSSLFGTAAWKRLRSRIDE